MTEYKPSIETIESITSDGDNSIITTADEHSYVKGNTVGFLIPQSFGMRELNSLEANVLEVTDDTLTVDINTTQFTPFVVPATFSTPAMVIPIGSTNSGFTILGTIPVPIGISGAYRVTN